MSKVLNQHYVPQSYLKYFSYDRNKIFVFDKFSQKTFRTNVRNVASERAFYDFPDVTQSENIQNIEQFFSGLEKKQNKFLKHLQKKIYKIFELRLNSKHIGKVYSVKVITKEQRKDLAYVIAIQFLRTREFRNFIMEMRQRTEIITNVIVEGEILDLIAKYEKLLSIKLKQNSIDTFIYDILNQCSHNISNIYDKGLPVIHAKFILEHYETFADILQNHIWMVGINDTGKPLFTSDNPVIKHSHLSHSGIDSEGIEIAFPLNSKIILIMRERQHFFRHLNQDSKLFPLTINDVEYYNKLQIYNSNRFVFSPDDCFEIVKYICQEYPEVCSEERNRITISKLEP